MTSTGPFERIEDGVAWYYEDEDTDSVRHEGTIELYPDWVRLVGPIPTWVPRERVEQVHER